MMHKICYWCWLQELICSCADVVPQLNDSTRADDDYDADVYVNDNDSGDNNNIDNNAGRDADASWRQRQQRCLVPNAVALLRTVAALIALDANPHHQHMRYLQQQEELQMKLQQLQQQQPPNFQQHVAQHFEQEQITVNAQNSCTKQPEQMLQQQQQLQEQEQQQQLDNVLYENCKAHMSDDVSATAAATIKTTTTTTTCYLYEQQQQQHQQLGTVGQLLRSAKQKTYEKIKQNLLNTHGQHSFQLNNNNSRTLQTIIESEHDVAAAGPAGHYQVIDEKQLQQQQQQQLQQQQQQQKLQTSTESSGVKPLAKRIEFFEQKPKLEVFSIYRMDEQQPQHKLEQLKQHEAGTSLLKHDSHTLTILLSCVFIVTFLWLVFFPLPG